MHLLLHLALRSLLRSRLSFLLLVAAVAAGVGFQIPNAANLNGYSAELMRKGLPDEAGHVTITASEGSIPQAALLQARIRALPFVRSVSLRLAQPGTLAAGDRLAAAAVVGIEAESLRAVALQAGHLPGPEEPGAVLLGSQVAETLRVRPGDPISIGIPLMDRDGFRLATLEGVVAGVREGTGGFHADHEALLSIGTLREALGARDAATELRILTSDASRSAQWAEAMAPFAGGLTVLPSWRTQPFVKHAIDANRVITLISTAMVIVAVMIPVLALFYIHVLGERRRIAVLSAIGFSRRDLFLVHLLRAVLVGGCGVGLGILLGAGLCAAFQRHPIFSNAGFVVRPELTLRGLLLPAAILYAAAILAGLLPALLAARAEPASALRED